jgi:hypothetical protein
VVDLVPRTREAESCSAWPVGLMSRMEDSPVPSVPWA